MALASVGNVLQRQRNCGAETQHVCDMEVNHKDYVQKYFPFDTVLKYHTFFANGVQFECVSFASIPTKLNTHRSSQNTGWRRAD